MRIVYRVTPESRSPEQRAKYEAFKTQSEARRAALLAKRPRFLTAAEIARGAAGVVRAVTGMGGATQEQIDNRTALCRECDQAVVVAGVFQQCRQCKCATWAKVRNAGERCPKGKW